MTSKTTETDLAFQKAIQKEETEFSELIVELFKATALSAIIYYVSTKMIYKLSEIMNGYQDKIYTVNRDVSSLVSEMGAMMQGGFFIDSPPQRFINIYGQEIADRVYKSMIELEGIYDKVLISLNGSNLRRSEVLETGLMLSYSNLYVDYEIHSVLSYFSKISIGGYLSYEVLNLKLYVTYIQNRSISKMESEYPGIARACQNVDIARAKYLGIDNFTKLTKVHYPAQKISLGEYLFNAFFAKNHTVISKVREFLEIGVIKSDEGVQEKIDAAANIMKQYNTELFLYNSRFTRSDENLLKLIDMIDRSEIDTPIIGDKICDAYTGMLSCPNLDI